MYAEAEASGAAAAQPATPADQTAKPEGQVKRNVAAKSTWVRLLFMAFFAVVYGILHGVLAVVVGLQFLTVLFTGSPNERLMKFGHELGIYYHDIVVFVTFKTEARPFPFSDWRREPVPKQRTDE